MLTGWTSSDWPSGSHEYSSNAAPYFVNEYDGEIAALLKQLAANGKE